MPEGLRQIGWAGLFDEPDALIEAVRKVRAAGFERFDCHTPYPVHGLSEAMGLKESPIGRYALGAGGVGAALAFWMQWWMSAVDYPLRIGGKPYLSWPAFLPITFEVFVLVSAISTILLATRFCGLWRWHSPIHDSGLAAEVTSARFVLVLRTDESLDAQQTARALLQEVGCREVRPLLEDPTDRGVFES